MPTPIAPLPAGLNTSGSTGTTDTTLSNIPTGSTSTNPLTVFNPQPAASTDQTQVAPAVVTPDAALKDLNHMQTVATNATTDMQNQSAKKVAATGDGTTGTGGLGIVDTIKGLISPITDQLAKNSKTNAQANADITAMNNNVHNPAPTGTTSSTTSTTPAPNPYLDKLQANQDEADKAYQDFKTQISQLQNGTFPLTPSQQAQIDGLQARFDQLKAAQQLANKNYEAGTTQVGIRTGQERYAPKIAQDNIKKAVDQGLQKIADIESQAADAVAKMTDGFQTQDFNLISKSYEAYNSYMKDKNDTLKTMMNEVDTQAKDLRDYNLNVQQFQQKQAEDNFSNAMANKTFDFNQKKQAFDEYIAKADLTEKQKTDAVDQWYKQQDIAIKQSNLALDRQKENFAEGQYSGSDYNGMIENIPGVKTLGNLGVSYFDPTQFTDKKQAAAAEAVARKAGVPILSDVKDRDAVTAINTALTNIDSLQQKFSELANKSELGNLEDKITRPFGAAFDTDFSSQLKAYQNNRDIIFQQISTLAGSHPRLNAQEITAAMNALPKLDYKNSDTLKDGINKLNQTRQYLNNSLNSVIPTRTYSTVDDYVKANPIDGLVKINAARAKFPQYSPDEVMQLINSGGGFNKPLSEGGNSSDVGKIASAIGQFESGGRYNAVGKDTGKGDRAMGKYQIMASNVPSWTKEALGYSMTAQQFLNDPKAQDAVAQYKMGQYYKKYGTVEDVATAWFAGPGAVGKNSQARDVVGTSVPQYAQGIRSIYDNLG